MALQVLDLGLYDGLGLSERTRSFGLSYRSSRLAVPGFYVFATKRGNNIYRWSCDLVKY